MLLSRRFEILQLTQLKNNSAKHESVFFKPGLKET